MTGRAHPGTIVFVDESTGKEDSKPVAQVPESVAFALVDGRRESVVRVVARLGNGTRTLTSYGADGRVLSTLVQRVDGKS